MSASSRVTPEVVLNVFALAFSLSMMYCVTVSTESVILGTVCKPPHLSSTISHPSTKDSFHLRNIRILIHDEWSGRKRPGTFVQRHTQCTSNYVFSRSLFAE